MPHARRDPRRRPPLAAAALGALAAAAAACMPGAARPPAAPVRGSLAPGALAAASPASTGPLRVAFAGPRGETTQDTELSVVFNKPMRPLGLGPHEPPPPVRMQPEVPGRWQWIGSSALRFNAAQPLPLATPFRVEIPAGTRALDGAALAEPYVLELSTPRPLLEGSEPAQGAEDVARDAAVTLWFNQPVADDEIARAVSIRAGAGAPVPFTVARDPGEAGGGRERARLVPRAPLPLGAEVKVEVDPSLRGEAGPLPAGKASAITFRTAGPLAVEAWSCAPHPTDAGACDPTSTTITLRLSNPAPAPDVLRAIAVEPRPEELRVTALGDEDGSEEFQIDGLFAPAKAYRLRLRARPGGRALRDVHGQALPADAATALRFGDVPGAITFGATGVYWTMGGGPHVLPVNDVNALDLGVTAAPLAQADVLARLGGRAIAPPEPDGARRFAPGPGKRNEDRWSKVRLEDLLPPNARGPVLVRASYRGLGEAESAVASREVQLTDLGVVSRVARDGAAVWVTALGTGQPLAGTRVEVHHVAGDGRGGKPAITLLGAGDADAQGLARVALRGMPPPGGRGRTGRVAVIARRGDDWAYQALDAPDVPEPVGDLFTERGIYRPGEELHIKGVFRMPATSGLVTPRGREVEVRVEAPDGRDLASFRVPLSPFGTFARAVRIPDDAALGFARVYAQLDRIAEPVRGHGYRYYPGAVSERFIIEEYRPADSTIEATVDRTEYAPGDTMRCGARGEYLYGAPMAGARASIVVSRSGSSPSIPGHQDFTFHEHDAVSPRAVIAQGSGVLDARGAFALPVSLALPGQVGAESLTCSVEVSDLNRQVRSEQTWALLHQGDLYVGLDQEDRYQVHAGEVVRPRVVAVTPAGVRRSAPVHIELVKRTRRGDELPVDQPLGACDVVTGPEPVSCAVTLPAADPGEDDYLVVRASSRDSAGRRVAASYEIGLTARPKPQPPAPPMPPMPPAPPRLSVGGVQERYDVGQTADIAVSSPYSRPARALVTVAREGLLLERVVDLPPHGRGDARVQIPITPAMVPNVFVSVIAVDGSESQKEDFRLQVSPEQRRLAVDVRPARAQAAPGDAVDVEVTVKDAAGKPARAEVTLWAADEATLQLIYYRTPDPMMWMFTERDEHVATADVRDELLRTWTSRHRTRPPQVRMGATSVSPPRGDFRQTVFFAADLVTDAAGRVRRRVKLPDGLTTYRFMAVAVADDDRFGSDDAQVQTSKPLMARPTLPRVIRAGDRFEASVVLSSIGLPPTRVTLDARAEGLVPLGPARLAATVSPDKPAELRFPLRADRAGRARFTASASGGSPAAPAATDSVTLSAPVTLPLALETAALHGDTAAAIAEQLGGLEDVRADAGGLSIALSPTPLAGLAPGIEQLLEYPYGCTEQTVSRMVPLLALRDLAAALGVKLPAGALPEPGASAKPTGELAAALESSVARVLGNQRPDGGFGYWPGSGESDRWVTAYALWGLNEAKRRGLPVRKDALDRAARYLEQHLAPAAPDRPLDDAQLATSAFLADVLAEAGSPSAPRMDALFTERARLPLFARALLLHAMAVARHRPDATRELARDIEAAVRIDGPLARVVTADPGGAGWSALLDSDARTTAMALRALVAADPRHPLAARLVLGLLEERRAGTWRTTQETAWSLLALDAWRRAQPPAARSFEARVFLGDALLTEAAFDAAAPVRRATATVPMSELLAGARQPLTFAASGGGRLHYEATLRFARKALPTEPVEAGFFVQKTLRPVSSIGAPGAPAASGAARIKAGEVVLVELDLVTPSPRRNVLLEDPLPGGLEPVSQALRTGGTWLASLEQTPATRRELRDDRVVYIIDALPAGVRRFRYLARATNVGTFITPPTHVEEMYAPETYGRTAASTVEVVPP